MSHFSNLPDDFKPASVDLSKTATLDVSSNNQVTVTMPHLGEYFINMKLSISMFVVHTGRVDTLEKI